MQIYDKNKIISIMSLRHFPQQFYSAIEDQVIQQYYTDFEVKDADVCYQRLHDLGYLNGRQVIVVWR